MYYCVCIYIYIYIYLYTHTIIHIYNGFKSHSGQFSIATSKNPSVMNTTCINSFRYTHVITSTKFRIKQMWRLTKTIAEMKCYTEQTMKLE